jgi:HAD superfamily hydrolase (TIGR01490 family)
MSHSRAAHSDYLPSTMVRCAIFDLDGTLLVGNSLLSFFRHYLAVERKGEADQAWQDFLAEVTALRASGLARMEQNAWFYRTRFCQLEIARIERLAVEWFSALCAQGTPFRPQLVQRLREHQRQGAHAMIATGSFREVTALIARELQIDTVVAAPLEELDGRYTGRLLAEPTIGAGKAAATLRALRQLGIAPAECAGYGDDHTDIPMLELVGFPHAVSRQSEILLAHAHEQAWPILEG